MSPDGRLGGRLSVERDGHDFLGARRIALLRAIAETGSISAAARAIGMSYKAAWDAVDAMNNLAERPLVVSGTGGRHGGGSRLTDYGQRQIAVFEVLEDEYLRMLARVEAAGEAFGEHLPWIRRLNLLTSARNQFLGRVVDLAAGPVNVEVVLDIGGTDRIAASITHPSLEALGLDLGSEAFALVKAPAVGIENAHATLAADSHNRLCGTVTRLHAGTDEAEIAIALTGGKTVVAVIDAEAFARLDLAPGATACATFDAASVLLAVAR